MIVQNRWVRGAVILLVVLMIFLFLGKELWKNWRQIPFEQIRFNYWLLALSFACMFASFLTHAGVWKLMLAAYGANLSYVHSFQIVVTSQLGKYIPGKVWFALGRMYLAKQFGVPERVSIVSVALESVLLVISGALIALLTIVAPWAQNFPLKYSLLALIIVVCGLFIAHPRVFGSVAKFVMTKLKRETIQVNVTYGGMVGLLLLYSVCWFWQGIGFFFLIRSFYEIEMAKWPVIWGIYALAWITGFLSFLAPAGLGVREGLMTLLLSFYMPLPLAVVVALVARIWSTAAEVLAFFVSLPAMRKWRSAELKREGS